MAGPTITGFVIPGSVKVWDLAHIQFDVSGVYSNNFDISFIQVNASVTSPTSVVTQQPCFWARYPTALAPTSGHGENYSALGTAHWYLNYKFPAPGTYTFTIAATNTSGTTISSVQSITVAGGRADKLSPWKVANTYYFTWADGTWFVPIGENVAVEDRDWTLDGTVGYAKWFNYIGANGGNVARYMLSAYHRNGPEYLATAAQYSGWDNFGLGLGQYSQQNCFRIDEALRIAALNGVSILFCYNTHGEFSTSSDPRWSDSPYNANNGGPIPNIDPAVMLTDATALKYQKMKARYMIARWAPSPAFGAIEHMNEGGSVGNGFFVGANTVANHAAWVHSMGTYIRSLDPWQHLMTWSEEWDPSTAFPGVTGQHTDPIFQDSTVDFSTAHIYQNSPWVINDRRFTAPDMIAAMRLRLVKPALHTEAGLYRTPSAPEPNFDPTTSGLGQVKNDHLLAGTHVHQVVLSSLASGFSGGLEWWHGSGMAEDVARHRTSGKLPYGSASGPAYSFPLEPAFQPAALIAAAENPAAWPTKGTQLAITVPGSLSAVGWGYNARALIYVADAVNNYGASEEATVAVRTISGATVKVPGLLDGAYNVEVWSTRTLAAQVEFAGGDPTGVADSQTALQTFFNANSGKVVGLPANAIYRLNSALVLTSWAGTVIGRNTKFQPHYTSGTKFFPLEIRGANQITIHDLEIDGSQVTTPATTASITNAANPRQQEHAIAIYGGTALTLINVKTHNFWGDGMWLTRWTLSGGDGSSPTNVTIYNHTADQHGRNAISVISSGGTSYLLNSTATNIGLDSFDIEPNVAADVVGSWVVNNCSFSTYDLGNNNQQAAPNTWGHGVAISSGGSSAVTRPSLDVRGVTIHAPSTSPTGMAIRYTTTFIADSNQSNTSVSCNFTTVPTIDWGTNTNITPSPGQGFTAPPSLSLPALPAGGGLLQTLTATSTAGSLSFPAPTIDRDAFYKVIPQGGGGGGAGGATNVFDSADRTVAAGGLGTADVGGAWTVGGTATDYSVNGSQLVLVGSAAGVTRRGALLSAGNWQNQDWLVRVQTDKVPTGASQTMYLTLRQQNLDNDFYRVICAFTATLSITLSIEKVVGGVNTFVANTVTPGRDTFAANTAYWIRAQAEDFSYTVLRAKVWKFGNVEPTGWDISGGDAWPSLQTTGTVGIRFYVGAATNTPVTSLWDELQGNDIPNRNPVGPTATRVLRQAHHRASSF